MSGEELRPTGPGLSRVRVDAVMGGVAVRVPKGCTTWWSCRGAMGGVGADAGVQRVNDRAAADLRVRAGAVMGGVGIENAEP